jgi:hypothetical protein
MRWPTFRPTHHLLGLHLGAQRWSPRRGSPRTLPAAVISERMRYRYPSDSGDMIRAAIAQNRMPVAAVTPYVISGVADWAASPSLVDRRILLHARADLIVTVAIGIDSNRTRMLPLARMASTKDISLLPKTLPRWSAKKVEFICHR